MSASEAVVKAVREAEERHYSVAVKWEVCSCGAEFSHHFEASEHQTQAVAAAAEAAALEAAKEAIAHDEEWREAMYCCQWRDDRDHVAEWLQERAGEVRDDD